MMTVTATEAKERLEELLDAATAGESVAIVRDGKPPVQLTATPRKSPEYYRQIRQQIAELAKGNLLGGESIRAQRDEGRP